jgi:hypothetical protein
VNTSTVEKDSVRNEITRRITDSYTVDNYRVKVSTWHDKSRKAYLTSVSECQIDKRDGYTMERTTVFVSYYKIVKAEKVSRYSFKSLADFHASTEQEAADIVERLIESHNEKEGQE